MKIRDDVNEYGTPISVFRCETCERIFTVCPSPENPDNWRNCLADYCDSYDEDRDADKILFDGGNGIELVAEPINKVR